MEVIGLGRARPLVFVGLSVDRGAVAKSGVNCDGCGGLGYDGASGRAFSAS